MAPSLPSLEGFEQGFDALGDLCDVDFAWNEEGNRSLDSLDSVLTPQPDQLGGVIISPAEDEDVNNMTSMDGVFEWEQAFMTMAESPAPEPTSDIAPLLANSRGAPLLEAKVSASRPAKRVRLGVTAMAIGMMVCMAYAMYTSPSMQQPSVTSVANPGEIESATLLTDKGAAAAAAATTTESQARQRRLEQRAAKRQQRRSREPGSATSGAARTEFGWRHWCGRIAVVLFLGAAAGGVHYMRNRLPPTIAVAPDDVEGVLAANNVGVVALVKV